MKPYWKPIEEIIFLESFLKGDLGGNGKCNDNMGRDFLIISSIKACTAILNYSLILMSGDSFDFICVLYSL
jgi:hypothetical protein